MCLASTVDAIPGKKSFRVSVIHVNVHVKLCERLPAIAGNPAIVIPH
jgi:hypothetical protein